MLLLWQIVFTCIFLIFLSVTLDRITTGYIEYLHYARHKMLIECHTIYLPVKEILSLLPFLRWRIWGSGQLSNLSVTQLCKWETQDSQLEMSEFRDHFVSQMYKLCISHYWGVITFSRPGLLIRGDSPLACPWNVHPAHCSHPESQVRGVILDRACVLVPSRLNTWLNPIKASV